MKKLGLQYAFLVPARSFTSSILKNTWTTAGIVPQFEKRCFDVKNLRNAERGCVASRFLQRNELLISVPWEHVIAATSSSQHMDNELTTKLYELVFRQKEGVECIWREYVSMLPENQDMFGALFWNLDLINQLQLQKNEHASLLAIHERLRNERETITERILGCSEDKSTSMAKIISNRVLWCQRIIKSRSFSVEAQDTEWRCLVPIADLFNHQPEAPWTQTKLENEGLLTNPWQITSAPSESPTARYLSLSCAYDTKPAQEIRIPYGCETNLELLSAYGFILEGEKNEAQYVPLYDDIYHLIDDVQKRIGITVDEHKLKVLESLDAVEAPLAIRPGKVEHSGHLIGCLMYLCAERMDTRQFKEVVNEDVGHLVLTACTENGNPYPSNGLLHQKALHLLSCRCREILDEFPTTLEQDKLEFAASFDENARSPGTEKKQDIPRRQYGLDSEVRWNYCVQLALKYRMDIKDLLQKASCWGRDEGFICSV